MSRTTTIVTPENIQVTYQVAGVASRFMAFLIDLCLQILLLLMLVFTIEHLVGISKHAGLSAASLVSATGIVLYFLVIFAYPIFWEMLWGGRTPGKRLLGLRVIREGGYPIHFMASLLRNILRFIDFGVVPLPGASGLVLCGLPGLLSIFFSPQYKRIGDYAAGTLVIVEGGITPFTTGRQTAQTADVAAFLPLIRHLDRLTPEEYQIVRRFTSRRQALEIAVQAALAERIARPLMQKLEIESPIMFQIQYADLLEALERRYAEERGVL